MVHAHPPTATAFAVAGEGIPEDVLPEITLLLGAVPVVPYATPGTSALGDAVEPFIAGREAVLLANHGALDLGSRPGPGRASGWNRWSTGPGSCSPPASLGRVVRLTREQIDALQRLRGSSRHGQTDLGS